MTINAPSRTAYDLPSFVAVCSKTVSLRMAVHASWCNVGCGVGLSPFASEIIIIFVLFKNQWNRVHCSVKQIVCEHSKTYLYV